MNGMDEKAVAWLQGANRLPVRNQMPPGRLLPNSALMSRDVSKNTHIPTNQQVFLSNKMATSFTGTSEDYSQRLWSAEADASGTKHTADDAPDTQFFANTGGADDSEQKKLEFRAKEFPRASASTLSDDGPSIGLTREQPLPKSFGNQYSYAGVPENKSMINAPSNAEESVVPLTSDALVQVLPSEKALLPGKIKTKRRHDTWEVSEVCKISEKVDVRNTIGLQHKLEYIGGRWVKDPWNGEGDDNYVFDSEEFNGKFIRHWRSKLPHGPEVDMTEHNVEHYKGRDIETESGEYLSPYQHEDTIRDDREFRLNPPRLKDHREKWTSEFLIEREERARGNLLKKQTHWSAAQVAEAQVSEVIPDDRPKLQVDCVLRPAKADDVPGIVDIYNLEIKRGIRAWDTKLVSNVDFNKIGRACYFGKLPFVVAVKPPVDLADPEKWPSRDVYEEYMRFRACNVNRDKGGENSKKKGIVLGFAFCHFYDSGLGSGKHTGRYSVRLSVYVHPDHRHIVIEALFRGKDDPDLTWMRKLLEKLGFKEQGHLQGTHCTQRGKDNSEWLDKYFWQHEAQVNRAVSDSDPELYEKPEGAVEAERGAVVLPRRTRGW